MENKIIVAVCGKPELYDSTNYYYRDKYRKDLAWRRVSEETGVAANPVYKRVGDSVVLNPGPLSDFISNAIWKHKSDLALEWFGEKITCYREFKGRCDLDQTRGSLIIKNLTLDDSGIYSPEINNKELDKMDLLVLQPVPKPTVSIQCNNEKTLCNLTCEANITDEFGPVAYKWKNEDGVLSYSKELEIKTEKDGSSFMCELENFVSNASSEAVTNPFSSGIDPAAVIVPVVIIILILIGVVAFLMYKKGYFTRLRTMASGVCSRASPNKEQGTQWTNGDVVLEQEVPLIGGINTGVENEAPNGAAINVSPGTSSQNEMPKDPNCDQPAVSDDVPPEPANVSRSNEGSNQNLLDVNPGTSSQTGDVRVDMEDEVQNSGVETENLDQAEPAEESVAVEIPENRDVADGDVTTLKEAGG